MRISSIMLNSLLNNYLPLLEIGRVMFWAVFVSASWQVNSISTESFCEVWEFADYGQERVEWNLEVISNAFRVSWILPVGRMCCHLPHWASQMRLLILLWFSTFRTLNKVSPGGLRDDMPPADGSLTVAKIAADLRPYISGGRSCR